jgi:hypothetical protein
MMNGIIKFRQTHNPNTVKGVHYTLSKVMVSAGQLDKAKEMATKSLDGTCSLTHFSF